MRPFARWIVTHKKIVAAVWAVIAVVAFAAVQPASDALSSEFSLPGRDSTEANQLIFERFGNGGTRVEGPIVLVAQVPEGRSLRDPAVRREVGQAFGAVTQAIPGSRAANLATTGDDLFVGRDGRTTFGVVWYPPAATAFDAAGPALEQARAAAARVQVAGAPVKVTGIEALAAGSGASEGPNVLIEVLIGGLFALIVLGVVFGSLMALVPLLMAAVAIPTTLIGLGVAIDYSLLIVMRWREERGAGRTNREAVIESMEHAGRAVIFSGIAVAIGLLALVALPVPFLRSIGYGGMLIPLVSTLVAVTLLPAMLDAWGPALDRIGFKRRTQSTQDGWVPWGRFVVRHRWLVGGAAFAILLVFMGPVINFTTGVPRAEALSASGPAREALDRGAVAPDGPEWRQGDLAVVNAFSDAETPGQTLDDLRDAVAAVPGEQVLVGGSIAGNADFNEAVYGNFIWVLLAILIVTYILLARSLRSLILPLKAVLFNIMSILAVWGFLVFFWQQGNGSGLIFGIEPTGALTVWIPLMVFAFLYGLSMDYEVFILSRMREEYDRVPSTDRAVVLGIARTGRLVTAGSLILFGAFIALASGPETDVKVFATALAVGIILDATIIRGALLPAFVAVLGRWNWWLPVWAARILRVEPSLPAPETLTGHDVDLGAPARPVPGTPAPDAT
ncbi:MAG: MMPL family transporter [Thermoleophilia bacterium]|nr:MMPL family transporter [Thermoleophilia bacterium]